MASIRPVKIAVIDSGVQPANPHVGRIAGGIGITREGHQTADYVDRIGHGTAVAAAILEKAPAADLFAVKIFHERLTTRIEPLVAAIGWAVQNGMDVINLSLGTANLAHKPALESAVALVVRAGILLVAAYEWLPGSLPGALPVALDWECPRDQYRIETLPDGRRLYRASGYPRPIPGIPPERNLRGISFAVANVTGLLVQERCRGITAD